MPLVEGLGFTLPFLVKGWGLVFKFRLDLVAGYEFPISIDDSTNILTVNPSLYIEGGLNVYFEI